MMPLSLKGVAAMGRRVAFRFQILAGLLPALVLLQPQHGWAQG
jgi:hypothetical protein